uniref:Solute carrier family 22 member 1-like n=1 Tax=Dermatophagoides pteronyssinus TaxID=6956 RepID=A0A6P6Y776_DERPT|nr:solute carrier family 22 member 1-like [Dermatophagoides pteronyssinus]
MSISPLDFILLQFGQPGYYLIFLCFLFCCLQLPIPSKQQNDYRSKINLFGVTNINHNSSSSHYQQQIFDQCNIYIDPIYHWKGKQSCPNGWEYWWPSSSNSGKNLVTEFNLVCEQKQSLLILMNLICLSSLFGAIIFGTIADRFGRCRILNLTIYLFIASSLSVYFVQDFLQFLIFYNLQIFFVNGLQISAYILLLELYPTPYQLRANFFWFIFYSLILILISLLVLAIDDWRYMQLSIAIPSFAFITYLFVLPSSPLWQTIVKQNQKSALKTLKHFSKFSQNSTTQTTAISLNQIQQHLQNLFTSTLTVWIQPSSFDQQQPLNNDDYSIQSPSSTIIHQQQQTRPSLSRPGPILRWFLLTNFYLFFVLTILNSFINTIYNTLIDLSFIILIYHLTIWLGSRIIQSLLFFINGLLIIVSLVLREYLIVYKAKVEQNDFDYRLLLIPPILMVIARSIGRIILIFISFHAVKSIPTNIRATGFGCCIFWMQIARISIPHLIVLSNYLPFHSLELMFGILALCNGGLSLLYPNLEQKPLPNTLIDLEETKQYLSSSFQSSKSSTMATTTRRISSLSSSKRYPSYRDLKTFNQTIKNQQRSNGNDIYMINNGNGDLFSLSSNYNTIHSTRQRSSPPTTQNLNNGHEILIHRNDLQNSLNSSNSNSNGENHTETTNSDERISLSDSPSNSFQAQIIQTRNNNSRPSYIPYNNNVDDPFLQELNSRLHQSHDV